MSSMRRTIRRGILRRLDAGETKRRRKAYIKDLREREARAYALAKLQKKIARREAKMKKNLAPIEQNQKPLRVSVWMRVRTWIQNLWRKLFGRPTIAAESLLA